jgi:hypothetical protein
MVVNAKRRREAWLNGTATTSDQEQDERNWTALWKVQIPSKLRVFLWRLVKQSIPTADVRHHHNMSPDSACSLCGVVDSWHHSLLECTMSKCVWALAPASITQHMMHTSEPEAKQWIFTMINTLKHDELIYCFVTL